MIPLKSVTMVTISVSERGIPVNVFHISSQECTLFIRLFSLQLPNEYLNNNRICFHGEIRKIPIVFG